MRVLGWNIWNGGSGRLEAIEQVLRDADADVVALQEANDRASAARLASAVGMELVYGEANSAFAVAWLSRLPVAGRRNHRLPVLDKTLLEVEVSGLRLFATHLSAGRAPADEPRRITEMEAILDHVGGGGCMLVGDFNSAHPDDEIGAAPPEEGAPPNYVSRRPIALVLEHGLVDCFRTLHAEEHGWTYLTAHPWARFDFVFASPDLTVERCEVLASAGAASDHFPVVADLGRDPVPISRT